jgi:RNA 2',3'-cyclic 3'-phosphodiesterase
MKRVFFAIDIKPEPRLMEAYDLIRHRLRLEKINWVTNGQMHITLVFMGDTEEDLIPGIISAAEKISHLYPLFSITLSSLGVFKNLRDPRVIWIGCDAGKDFQQLRADLENALTGFGYEPENRAFSPHLTLGRIRGLRDQNQLSQVIALYKDAVFQQQLIQQVVLYESRLTPAGPEYIPLKKLPLKTPEG